MHLKRSLRLYLLALTAPVFASSQRIHFPNPTGYSTTTWNAHVAAATPHAIRDFSNDAFLGLWDRIGPVASPINTAVVEPTPEPASYHGFAQPNEEFHPLVMSHFPDLRNKKLPRNFMWGVASSAYQIEGAAKEDGKGPSIWDLLAHRVPGYVADNTTGDVLAEHYYLYKQDIARLKALGIPAFSPSISWPRLFPFGVGPVNEAGVRHYDDVIATMLRAGITPAITLFHWDTPLALFEAYGAWTSERIVNDFFQYAKFVIERYDAYVPVWFTINEPQYCNWQYSTYPAGKYYPAYDNITGGHRARFLCGHYTLLAHAKVAKWYKEEFKGKGRITFKNSGGYFEPASNRPEDVRSALRNYDFSIGWFGGVWTDGDYPATLKATLGNLLPKFAPHEKRMIQGSCDFFAIDAYTASTAYGSPNDEACTRNPRDKGFPECAPTRQTQNGFPIGPSADTGANWLKNTPRGIRRYLKQIKEMFPRVPDIQVTEFGFAEPFESQFKKSEEILWDLRRADYYQGFLDNILAAIHYDGVNVTGAWGWSIFDNFEWQSGLSTRFGLQYLNYTDLSRTPKASMFQFLNWFREHR